MRIAGRTAPPLLSALAIVLVIGAAPSAQAHRSLHLDLLGPEIVGETGTHTYDLYQRRGSNDDRTDTFLGTVTERGGTLVGAGLGMRVLVGLDSGLLVGAEAGFVGGRITGSQLPFESHSTAWHAEVLTLLGYELVLDPVMLHVAAVFGAGGTSMDVAGPTSGTGPSTGAAAGASGPGTGGGDLYLQRWDLRTGVQVGGRVQLTDEMAVFVDGTLDVDGQWRVRAGLSLGALK